jgi:ribosome-associated heat shock protein Hsp15
MARSRNHENHPLPDERMRLDKWLWAARFFKTRQLAIDAINGGKVHLNGQRTKPGKEIGVGARLKISKDQFTWDITIQALSSQRRPAAEAALLYEESPESIEQRQAEVARRREERSLALQPETRPNKKERRQIHRFKRGPE